MALEGMPLAGRGPTSGGGSLPSSLPSLGKGNIFIDPSNVSGLANDSNSGATALLPIRTTNHLNALLLFQNIDADLLITYMSDENTTQSLYVGPNTVVSNNATVTVVGTPQVLEPTRTITLVQVEDGPTNARGYIESSDPDIFDFTPYRQTFDSQLHNPAYVHGLPGSTVPTLLAWLAPVNGTGRPVLATSRGFISTPLDDNDAPGNFVLTESFEVARPSKINVAFFGPAAHAAAVGGVIFKDLQFNTLSAGQAPQFIDEGFQFFVFQRCSHKFFTGISSSAGFLFNNCYINDIASALAIIGTTGGLILTGAPPAAYSLYLSDNTYVTGFGILVDPLILPIFGVSGAQGANTGAQFWECLNPNAGQPNAALIVQGLTCDFSKTANGTPGLLWGNTNRGRGIVAGPGGTIVLDHGTPPKLVGVLGEFGFVNPVDGTIVGTGFKFANESYSSHGVMVASGGGQLVPALNQIYLGPFSIVNGTLDASVNVTDDLNNETSAWSDIAGAQPAIHWAWINRNDGAGLVRLTLINAGAADRHCNWVVTSWPTAPSSQLTNRWADWADPALYNFQAHHPPSNAHIVGS